MREHLLQWQWQLYSTGHRDRANLALHAVTAPLFQLGTLALLAAPFLRSPWAAVGGLATMVLVLAAQGRGHRGEGAAPVPFLGPVDFVSRFFAEQFVTFPRYVLSGGFVRAWRGEK